MFQIMQKQLPSVMQHSFSQVPRARIPRSQFKRNFRHITTFNADYLVPFYVDEVLPADTAQMNFSSIIRMVTPETPFMDNLYLDIFIFYTPLRLLQDNFVKMMGERKNPADSIDYATPKVIAPAGGFVPPSNWASPSGADLSGALYDYLGYATRVQYNASYKNPNNYLARAYNLIWNEWFRDQNLQDSVVVDTDDGPDTYTDYKLLKRGKRHDYFTSCLPWLQKGTAEDLPIGTSAPLSASIADVLPDSATAAPTFDSATSGGNNMPLRITSGANTISQQGGPLGSGATDTLRWDSPNLYADLSGITVDLSTASGVTIGALYQSFAIQDLLQTDARGGTRYVELLNAHFGVTSPDFRLQRPEYLGGASIPFIVNPLAQTSESATTELGTLAATAAASMAGVGFSKSFVEHGVIIGLMCVRADLTYQQGTHRSLLRDTRYDFYWPALANLGEQEVWLTEIYTQGTSADDDIFGYQERWGEYRYGRTMITGRMRSNDPVSLDVWHLAEQFSSAPALNSAFIQQNTPIDRVVAVTTEPHFKGDIFGQGSWARPLPLFSVPGLLNRF